MFARFLESVLYHGISVFYISYLVWVLLDLVTQWKSMQLILFCMHHKLYLTTSELNWTELSVPWFLRSLVSGQLSLPTGTTSSQKLNQPELLLSFLFNILEVIFSYWMHMKWHFWHLFHQSQSNLWSEKQFPSLPRGCNRFFFEPNRDLKKSKRNQICRISISSISDLMSDQCVQLTDCRDLSSREKEMFSKKVPSFIRRYSSRPRVGVSDRFWWFNQTLDRA